jgi:hypothetical protein
MVVVPARQATWLAGGPAQEPYTGVDFIPQSGTYEFGYCTVVSLYLVTGLTLLPSKDRNHH